MIIISYLNLFGLLILFTTIIVILIFSFHLLIFTIKKKAFPKKLLIASFIGILLVSIQVGYSKYFFTFNTDDGEFYKGPVNSPTEKYTATAHYKTYGGAAGGVNLWVEITFNDEDNKIKTIYYSDAKSNFSMIWKNEDTLYIVNEEPNFPSSNRSIELNVEKEIYHDRGLVCKNLLMKKEYETCYQN
ncbi:DUF5412 family protein [Anaerobacillus isosaccharinicus]|uniref:Uncharacterized protein n=1 Tax=Anaerobacillus isosaccharinicus TaxID=1532552 RepID=A0A1S2L7R1_9BACI|nr:DUF5412 family protein [Anaerobacillus isosaccharinicus]MBA5586372.1 hypothetical protein [Anaerobacillus isosaccharinicus]QOY35382.1 hypothetical protein AWH56_022260 [Anaerobacillus isosaccharinicus]